MSVKTMEPSWIITWDTLSVLNGCKCIPYSRNMHLLFCVTIFCWILFFFPFIFLLREGGRIEWLEWKSTSLHIYSILVWSHIEIGCPFLLQFKPFHTEQFSMPLMNTFYLHILRRVMSRCGPWGTLEFNCILYILFNCTDVSFVSGSARTEKC